MITMLNRDFPRIRLNMLTERRKLVDATLGDYATLIGFCLAVCTTGAVAAWILVQIVLKIQ